MSFAQLLRWSCGYILLVWLAPQAVCAETVRARLALPNGRIDVVLDSDMYNEVDDQFALAYALHSANRINLEAVCAAPFLNHRSKSAGDGMERSFQETVRVLNLLERSSDEFVFRGSKTFLPDRRTAVDSPAARRIIEIAKQDRNGPLVVVGLGAATNIASALLIEPAISERIVVVWIGGHPHTWDHAGDLNLNQDIAAAQVLFDIGVPLVHVPAGDVAASLKISLPELEAGLNDKSPIAEALLRNVQQYYAETGASKKQPRSGVNAWQKVIWDIAAIAWLVDPEKFVTSEIVPSPMLTDEANWNQAANRHPVRVAVRLDRQRIYADLFAKLGRPYLPSPVIGSIEFDFRTHRRLAEGSDNWPTTWADDGNLYTAWGDGGGSRDEFVYSYFIEPRWGPTTPAGSKYGFEVHQPGRLHLARVPKQDIMQRERFEFFAGLDENKDPTWTSTISAKQPVFRDDNGVGWNISVIFNAGLNRFLLATEHSATHAGKFGLFDAPQPWGPWTTVGYEDNWGNGHVEVSAFYWNFPTKWLSKDGREFTMVFTGKNSNDSWNTVRGRFLRR